MILSDLIKRIADGTIDTVQVAAPDHFGRLVGKRFTGRFFAENLQEGVTHACKYLFAVDLAMDPQEGYSLANWESGFGDFEMRPDHDAIFLLPWEPGSVLVLCDFHHHEGHVVEQAPRAILRRQLARLAERGLHASVASELEFFLYHQTYSEAAGAGWTGLKAASDYRIDYHLLQPAREEGLFRVARNQMVEAGIPVESSKGEWGRGQHELNIAHGEPVLTADRHTVFKQGMKHLANAHGRSATFMAKPFHGEAGSSCHIHISLWRGKENAFWDGKSSAPTTLFKHFLAGMLRYSREFCLLFAPTVNSYKRYEAGSWAPTRLTWSTDNRTTGYRVVGHGPSFRAENRMPGADANPYCAFAAMLAAGLAGIDEELLLGPEYRGNAYVDKSLPALPSTLQEAVDLFAGSALARDAFTVEVAEHLVHSARVELRDFNASVTDWERKRYFEQI